MEEKLTDGKCLKVCLKILVFANEIFDMGNFDGSTKICQELLLSKFSATYMVCQNIFCSYPAKHFPYSNVGRL